MLFLLRKIRRKLLMNNKVSTYLFYAVGEVFLVVLGILIAVQIDEWNEHRKLNIQQLELLQSLHSDISHNLKSLQTVINNDSVGHFRTAHILELVQKPDGQYHDSLQVYFASTGRFDVFQPKRMTYEVFKTKGLELISNSELRSEIIGLYDEVYSLNPWVLEVRKDIHFLSVTILNKRFMTYGRASLRIPNDFEALKSDAEYINHLSYVTAENSNILGHYNSILGITKSVQKSIENELDNLTKK